MLFVFSRLGWLAEKISVSPFAGVPAKPQLALLLQLASVPPPPDQLKMAARLSTTPASQANPSIATAASRFVNCGDLENDDREKYGLDRFLVFIFPWRSFKNDAFVNRR